MTHEGFRQQFSHVVRLTFLITTFQLYILFLTSFTLSPSYAHIGTDEAWQGFVTERSSGKVNTLVEYIALLADEEAFSDSPERVRFKSKSLQYFLTTGGPNGFLKPEEDKRSEEQKRADQTTLKKAAVYVGILGKQKKETLDIFAVRAFYAKSPIPAFVQTHLEIVQLIVSSATYGSPHQKTRSEEDSKEHPSSSETTHPLFKKYSASQLNDILTPNFEGWVEVYQALFEIQKRIDPGLTFQVLPLENPSLDTVTKFSLKNGEITWQESAHPTLTKTLTGLHPYHTQQHTHRIATPKINMLRQTQLLRGGNGLILEGDEINLPLVVICVRQFVLIKPHKNKDASLRVIILRKLEMKPYSIVVDGLLNFSDSEETSIEELIVNGCRVLLGSRGR